MSATVQTELHPCARCARLQRTCCQRAEVLVTLGDLDRIEAHRIEAQRASAAEPVPAGPFHERRRPTDPDYLDDDPDDPLWRRATVAADGTRRVLRRRANGDCIFLGQAGCVLPGDVRPLVCRLYPFAFTEAGLVGEAADYCPTADLGVPAGSMAQRLGMRPGAAEAWRRALYVELRAEVAQCAQG